MSDILGRFKVKSVNNQTTCGLPLMRPISVDLAKKTRIEGDLKVDRVPLRRSYKTRPPPPSPPPLPFSITFSFPLSLLLLLSLSLLTLKNLSKPNRPFYIARLAVSSDAFSFGIRESIRHA